jgi:hypothetical protein
VARAAPAARDPQVDAVVAGIDRRPPDRPPQRRVQLRDGGVGVVERRQRRGLRDRAVVGRLRVGGRLRERDGGQDGRENGESRVIADTSAGHRLRRCQRISTPFRNNGLGLALVARIAALHGATLTVAPRPGGGLIVTLAVPRG